MSIALPYSSLKQKDKVLNKLKILLSHVTVISYDGHVYDEDVHFIEGRIDSINRNHSLDRADIDWLNKLCTKYNMNVRHAK